MDEVITRMVNKYSNGVDEVDEWDLAGLNDNLREIIPFKTLEMPDTEKENITREGFIDYLKQQGHKLYDKKEMDFDDVEELREAERIILLKVIDQKWMDHIDNMDQMRQGIGLRSLGQKDPLVEYKFIGFEMFDETIESIQEDTVKVLFRVVPREKLEREQVAKNITTNRGEDVKKKPVRRTMEKVGRNDPCPCGSGKKYKQCCGK